MSPRLLQPSAPAAAELLPLEAAERGGRGGGRGGGRKKKQPPPPKGGARQLRCRSCVARLVANPSHKCCNQASTGGNCWDCANLRHTCPYNR
ncbi:hypothetical protein MGN70_005919 [Eutypa lata]|nr:hypothetical protein MGN70_005919 [Eutypa lata]